MAGDKVISKDEVAAKNSADKGMYIIVDDSVYDVTEFVNGTSFRLLACSHISFSTLPALNASLLGFATSHHPSFHQPICPPISTTSLLPAILSPFACTITNDDSSEHPGGSKILKRVAGKDATKQFWKYHNESVLKKYSPQLKVGTVGEKAKL